MNQAFVEIAADIALEILKGLMPGELRMFKVLDNPIPADAKVLRVEGGSWNPQSGQSGLVRIVFETAGRAGQYTPVVGVES